jgi:hypothetical protein
VVVALPWALPRMSGWHDALMGQSHRERLDSIERDLLSGVALADCLRACVALALAMESEGLREWAERELNGYAFAEVPDYRHVPAVVVGDIRSVARHDLRNETVPADRLPEVYQAVVEHGFPIHLGLTDLVPQCDRLARDGEPLHLSITDAPRLAQHLTKAVLRSGARYTDVRYQITEADLRSMFERIRGQAVHVLHDIRALTPADAERPARAGNQAVSVVNHGSNNQFTVTTNQAQHGNASSTHTTAPGDSGIAHEALRWTKRQTRWTIAGGIIAVIGLLVAVYFGLAALDAG